MRKIGSAEAPMMAMTVGMIVIPLMAVEDTALSSVSPGRSDGERKAMAPVRRAFRVAFNALAIRLCGNGK